MVHGDGVVIRLPSMGINERMEEAILHLGKACGRSQRPESIEHLRTAARDAALVSGVRLDDGIEDAVVAWSIKCADAAGATSSWWVKQIIAFLKRVGPQNVADVWVENGRMVAKMKTKLEWVSSSGIVEI